MQAKDVLILGAGVSGLSTGILLLQKGYVVTIWAKELPPNTTSNKAAAVWYPYLCYPREKAIPWARTTFELLQNEFVNKPETGVILRTVTEMFDVMQPAPWWKDAYPGVVERPSKEELPEGYIDAYRLESIVIDTSIYMEYLMGEFKKLGGAVTQKEVHNIQEAFTASPVVINCTGLGSRTLFGDEKVFPVRGQMIKIKANGFTDVVVDDEGPQSLAAIIPRTHDIMLAGTAQKNNWNMEIDPADTKEILRKMAIIAPKLTNIDIISEALVFRFRGGVLWLW
jgi:D-amino-acid oxidase